MATPQTSYPTQTPVRRSHQEAAAARRQRTLIRGLLNGELEQLFEAVSAVVGSEVIGRHPLHSSSWMLLAGRYGEDDWPRIEAEISARRPDEEGGVEWVREHLEDFAAAVERVVVLVMALPEAEDETEHLVLVSRAARAAYVRADARRPFKREARILADMLQLLLTTVASYLAAYMDTHLESFWTPEAMDHARKSGSRHRPVTLDETGTPVDSLE